MNKATDEDYLRDEAQNDLKPVVTRYDLSTGCWIDSRWGYLGVIRLIEIAQEYGFELDDCEKAAIAAYKLDHATFKHCGIESHVDDWVLMQGGIADAAEDYLNDNIAKEGFSFGWSEGEFFLMEHSWWENSY